LEWIQVELVKKKQSIEAEEEELSIKRDNLIDEYTEKIPLSDGSLIKITPDGSIEHIDSQGEELGYYPPGSDFIINEDTGKIEIQTPDGTKTFSLDEIFDEPFVVTEGSIETETAEIPDWIKNNAKWWADGAIDDKSFTNGIEYLIKEEIITSSELEAKYQTSNYLKLNSDQFVLPNEGSKTEVILSGHIEDYIGGNDVFIIIEKPDGTEAHKTAPITGSDFTLTMFVSSTSQTGEYHMKTKFLGKIFDSISFVVTDGSIETGAAEILLQVLMM